MGTAATVQRNASARYMCHKTDPNMYITIRQSKFKCTGQFSWHESSLSGIRFTRVRLPKQNAPRWRRLTMRSQHLVAKLGEFSGSPWRLQLFEVPSGAFCCSTTITSHICFALQYHPTRWSRKECSEPNHPDPLGFCWCLPHVLSEQQLLRQNPFLFSQIYSIWSYFFMASYTTINGWRYSRPKCTAMPFNLFT